MQLFFTITEFLKSLTHVFFSQNNLESFFNRWLAAVCNVFNVPLNSLFAVIHCTTRSRFVHLKGLRTGSFLIYSGVAVTFTFVLLNVYWDSVTSVSTPEDHYWVNSLKALTTTGCPKSSSTLQVCKFVKMFKSLTVESGRIYHLFLDQCPKYSFSAA